ncbi:MAG: transglycosylase domain-containing protein [Burkholderiales bacterium]|nr:transglycosylase domain-containing protein [Burkholderiales bacterium]MDE1928762.1 transglycosylase domain-containing protein [Burkholderiales bacterium]MDE2159952.1 transglycosylase domain-containing protein [Burkholderiales bacterium]MDE2503673.1 transglycosylase domain-containing protein [Burkholderiales bacterium]
MAAAPWRRRLGRPLALLALCTLALELVFVLRIGLMKFVLPESTTFQRSEIARLLVTRHRLAWSQDAVPMARISPNLARAVVASEDADFVDHDGVEWAAIEKAWHRNERAEQRAEARAARSRAGRPPPPVKIVGGSTITQQLAKNLFLSGERTVLRKGQELLLAYTLEGILGKSRILEIYLDNVEWGEGVFGAEAAAHHYFHLDASRLGALQAARLAVMLPAPKRFEQHPDSPYVVGRASTIVARMPEVKIP